MSLNNAPSETDGLLTQHDASTSHHVADAHAIVEPLQVRRSLILLTLPIFMGYAALVSFQADVKNQLGIKQDSSASYAFGTAVSLLFLAALVLRLLHSVLLAFLQPRQRVILAFAMMTLANAAVPIIFYVGRVTSLVPVFFVYVAGGVAVGTFEVNAISFVTPFGHQSKKWALLGMPLGYNGIAIGGFLIFAAFPGSALAQGVVFAVIAASNAGGLLFFLFSVPDIHFAASVDDISVVAQNMKCWREWMPLLVWSCACLFCDMFACILASTIALYVFDTPQVALWPSASATVPQNVFLAVFNLASCVGDTLSRQLAYKPWGKSYFVVTSGNPARFLVLTAIGLALCLCKVALVAPIGMFLIMFGNGSIYASTTRFIDDHVDHRFNLIAISFWLFCGDSGSFIASNVVTPIRNVIGGAA